jgi:membrane-associated phospholipid phosphatase
MPYRVAMIPLDGLHQSEIGLILLVQRLPEWLTPLMVFFSALGTETFFLVLLPIVYWCVDPRLGVRVGLILLVTAGINAIGKLATHGPRPYWVDARVKALATETSFGMPSGHAQVSLAIWGVLAAATRKPAAYVAAGILVILIGFSRVYLGVHFISDVVIGLILGAITLWLVLRFEAPVVAWWQRRALAPQVVLALCVSLIVVATALVVTRSYADWSMPAAWAHATKVDAESSKTLIAMSGALFGLLAGASAMHRLGWFDAGGPILQRIGRWLFGSIGLGLIYFALKKYLPHDESLAANTLRYFGYAALTLWVQLVAPLLFVRLRLARRHVPQVLDALA